MSGMRSALNRSRWQRNHKRKGKVMKKLIRFISNTIIGTILLGCITTGSALAHSGHATLDQLHGLLHAEHVFILAGVIGVIAIGRIIKKRF